MSGPNWKLEDDCEHVTLTLPTDPPTVVVFNTATVDDMLKHLGDFRGQMKPPIQPTQWKGGQTVDAIPDPAWYTEPDALMGNTLLHIRDPGHGWLHYLLPRETAKKLANLLQTQADAPPPGQQSDKPN
jgi:hypothetical protein